MTRHACPINYEELAGRGFGDLIEPEMLAEPSDAYGRTRGGNRTDE